MLPKTLSSRGRAGDVKVTDRRTAQDVAHGMKDLVDLHCPNAAVVRVVLANLNTYTPAALYATVPSAEACLGPQSSS